MNSFPLTILQGYDSHWQIGMPALLRDAGMARLNTSLARRAMASSQLPDRLRYLQPALNELAKLPFDELNEDVDVTLFESLVQQRITELNDKDANKILTDDLKSLEEWLRQPGMEQSPGHFVLGWLMGFIEWGQNLDESIFGMPMRVPIGLAVQEPKVEWQLPPGFVRKEFELSLLDVEHGAINGIFFEKRDWEITQAEQALDTRIKIAHDSSGSLQAEADLVRFGPVQGKKCVFVSVLPEFSKSVIYLLRVPGGCVEATFNAFGNDFEESCIESTLHTLRLTDK